MKNKEFLQQKKAACQFADWLQHKKRQKTIKSPAPSSPSWRLLIAPWLSYRDSNSE